MGTRFRSPFGWLSTSRGKSALYVLGGAAGFLLVFFLIHIPDGPEHWSADLRTAYLSQRLDKQHPGKLLLGTADDSPLVWDYGNSPKG